MKNLFAHSLLLLLIFIGQKAFSQEFNCVVTINAAALNIQDPKMIKDLQTAIQTFMNTTKWSDENYKTHEKINCNIAITLNKTSDPTTGTFKAEKIQIQASRPVYNTDYETKTFVYFDRVWNFQYTQSQPLAYNPNAYTTELVALLSYYAYLMLAFDAESFQLDGSKTYRDKALEILNQAQSGTSEGWVAKGNDRRHRYWLATNLANTQFEPFLKAIYTYHRKVLDVFYDPARQEDARKLIVEQLKEMQKIYKAQSVAAVVNVFFDAKSQELQKIFSVGDLERRKEAVTLMNSMDPLNASQYNKLLTQ